jgi:predicted adenylyl cyclase CyaB
MGRNVEIKAKVEDLAGLRNRVEPLADRGPIVIHQEDTFFACPSGRLKLRRVSEREGELIFYQRPDSSQPTESLYFLSRCQDPDGLTQVLSRALAVRGVVRKRRTLYWMGQTRIHLDEVDHLGTYLELEVVLEDRQSAGEGTIIAQEILGRLGIQENALVKEAYIDILEA